MDNLHFKEIGSGPKIIILHGLLGSLDNWITIGKNLSKNFHVYLVDLINHGNSPHTEEFNYSRMADDLYNFFLSNNINKAHLIGHSMGGKVTMKFANIYQNYIDKLIIVDIVNKNYPTNRFNHIFKALNNIKINNIKSRKEADQQTSNYINNLSERNFLLKNLKRNKDGFFLWKPNIEVISSSINHISSQIEINNKILQNTLFLRGEFSDYIIESDVNIISNDFDNFNLITISNSGHWIHAENPSSFYEKVNSFLKN